MLAEDQQKRLKLALIERACSERAAFICDMASQIVLGIGTVTAVASGFYGINTLVFITASLNTLSVALSRYSTTSKRKAVSLAALANQLSTASGERGPALEIIAEESPPSSVSGARITRPGDIDL